MAHTDDNTPIKKDEKYTSKSSADAYFQYVESRYNKFESKADKITDTYSALIFATFAFLAGSYFTLQGEDKIAAACLIFMELLALSLYLLSLWLKAKSFIEEALFALSAARNDIGAIERGDYKKEAKKISFFSARVNPWLLMLLSFLLTFEVWIQLIILGIKL